MMSMKFGRLTQGDQKKLHDIGGRDAFVTSSAVLPANLSSELGDLVMKKRINQLLTFRQMGFFFFSLLIEVFGFSVPVCLLVAVQNY